MKKDVRFKERNKRDYRLRRLNWLYRSACSGSLPGRPVESDRFPWASRKGEAGRSRGPTIGQDPSWINKVDVKQRCAQEGRGYNVVWRNVVWRNVVWRNVVWRNVFWHNVVNCCYLSLIVVTCHTRRSWEFPHLRAKRRSPCDAQTGSERAWDTEKAKSVLCKPGGLDVETNRDRDRERP